MPQVFAVILTYNREKLLKRCLEAVYAQTRPCDGVIVVDNASREATRELLLDADYPNFEVYVLSQNIGASGGFNAGFRIAYQKGADFVWMMDDDVIPRPNALQYLMEADETLNRMDIDRAFLISMALTESGLVTDPPGLSAQRNEIGYLSWPEMVEHGMVPVRHTTFVSILVPRSTLEEHGLPISSMFIWGEDTEYTLRITQSKPGFLVGASKVLHLRHDNGPISILTETNPLRIEYFRYFIRNKLFITRKYSRRYRFVVKVYKVFLLFFNLLFQRQFRKARVVMHGLLSSVFFSPDTEAVDSPIETLGASVRLLERPSSASPRMTDTKTSYMSLAETGLFSGVPGTRGPGAT